MIFTVNNNAVLRRILRWTMLVMMGLTVRPETGLQRVTPQGVKMPLVPGVATEYVVQNEAFPGLEFEDPVAIVSAPGEPNRLYIVERKGRIILIRDLNNPQKEVFMDISARVNSNYTETETGAEGLNSVAFHPGHGTNGTFYLVYTHRADGVNLNRLSRFTNSSADRGDAASEFVMIEQPDTGYGHNFNDVKFGPDGYLYVAVGDEGDGRGAGDEYQNSQRIDKDFFSAILRLDVDFQRMNAHSNAHPALRGGYKIPTDNPYFGATSFNGKPVDPSKVRTEFWAVGFRNPWRMFFDVDGTLYAGDVGRHEREEINIVRKGGNYGWAFVEGIGVGSALGTPPAGVTLTPPVVEYPHGWGPMEGNCVIGGVVYRGDKLPGLYGAYVFGDFVTGNIWAIRHNGSSATEFKKIAGLYDISAFGIDPRNGDILVCKDKLDGPGDGIYRLEGKAGGGQADVPATLAETGLFSNVRGLIPVEGFVPYEVNSPLWSDGAEKRRWFGLLEPTSFIEFDRTNKWVFPTGAIWIKHFDLELEKGNPASKRRVETRVLVKNNSNDGIYGVTYRWGDTLDNATLVPAEGASAMFAIKNGTTTNLQTWNFPGRSDCLACHTRAGGYSLGFHTAQLNRDYQYPLAMTNQIAALHEAGYIDGPHTNLHTLPRLAAVDEEEWSREYRVRSYLEVNCANCHNPTGVERARWDGRITTPLAEMKLIHGELLDSFGNVSNRVVVPGNPDRSVLLTRMKTRELGHMPPLGSTVVDEQAVALIEGWISDDLENYKTFEQWVTPFNLSASGRADDPDEDGASNYLEYLLATNPADPTDGFAVSVRQEGGKGVIEFPQKANRGFEVQTSGGLPAMWKVLDVPGNKPFFSATNRLGTVDFPLGSSQSSFYRVRVFEP
jgi:uncharacterized repeat protein (TIGR03806 family)